MREEVLLMIFQFKELEERSYNYCFVLSEKSKVCLNSILDTLSNSQQNG